MSKKLIITGVLLLVAGVAVVAFLATRNSGNKSTSTSTSTNVTTDKTSVSDAQAQAQTQANDTATAITVDGISKTALSLLSCGYTTQTTSGPYYVTGTDALVGGNLNYDNLGGTAIRIGGYVYGSENATNPIANAEVDIWQAGDSGSYYPQNNGAATKYSADQISLRGHVFTDENGYYEFTSIYPGEYSGRVRHVHIRASSADYSGVITQIILTKDDDRMSNSQDNIARSLDLSCAQPTMTDVNGELQGAFNFYLKN